MHDQPQTTQIKSFFRVSKFNMDLTSTNFKWEKDNASHSTKHFGIPLSKLRNIRYNASKPNNFFIAEECIWKQLFSTQCTNN